MASSNTVAFTILDKEYQVACPPEKRDALIRAARDLDKRMRAIRDGGSVIGLERIAVMAALNLNYELLETTSHSGDEANQAALKRIAEKLDSAIIG